MHILYLCSRSLPWSLDLAVFFILLELKKNTKSDDVKSWTIRVMGNKSTHKHKIRSPLVSLEKLKLDVLVADELRTLSSNKRLLFSDNVRLYTNLRFQLYTSNKISRNMLPLVWKFNNNVIVEACDLQGNVSHFDPKTFYTLFSTLKDIQKATTQEYECLTDPPETSCDDGARQPSYDDYECALCMDAKVDVVTTCAHAFCNDCLTDWKDQNSEPTCPVCRGSLARMNSDDRLWDLDTADSGSNVKQIIESMCERVSVLLATHRVGASMVCGNVHNEDVDINTKVNSEATLATTPATTPATAPQQQPNVE